MNEFSPPPAAISHKKLTALMANAQKDAALTHNKESNVPKAFSLKKQEFELLMLNWSSLSKELLKELKGKSKYLTEGKRTKAIMALGALEAHLHLAIQAQEEAEK